MHNLVNDERTVIVDYIVLKLRNCCDHI